MVNKKRTIKKLIIHTYNVLYTICGIERCKKREPLKPMGIGKSIYPPDYTPIQKRTFSDGTEEYYIPAEAQKRLDEAWKKMGEECIEGKSKDIKKVK